MASGAAASTSVLLLLLRSADAAAPCPALTTTSHWRPPTRVGAGQRARPFIILFDGSAGSSWFADSLGRHSDVFIAGYEPLEWVGHSRYIGSNSTAWQAAWFSTVWSTWWTPARGSGGDESAHPDGGTWEGWLQSYYANEKLDPSKHHAPLTVVAPSRNKVARAAASGFKVRPANIESNELAGCAPPSDAVPCTGLTKRARGTWRSHFLVAHATRRMHAPRNGVRWVVSAWLPVWMLP
jgi:hypothetical protein